MTDKAEFERLLDVYGFRCERFGQDLSTHARAQVVAAFAALASAPVADVPLTHRCANCGAVFQGAGCPSCRLAAPVASAPVAEPGTMEEIHRQERERSPWVLPKDPTLPDSAPVAGEAKNYPGENVAERLDNMADDQPPGSQAQSDLYAAATIWRKHIAHRAAPQASEAVRTQVLAALESAQRFIRNGIEFGYIRMPDADTPDPAHRTPGLIDAAIRSLKSQADKDGGQQRAAEASAPVAGEALNDLQALQWAEKYGIQWALHTPDAIREVIADAQRLAAPQASAEDVRNAALEQAAKLMDQTLRSNGAALIRGLKRSQADKDGGQQRAGDVDERTAWAADMVAAGAKHLGEECWEWESDDFLFHLWQVATGRKQNAALSATLAEQGERDA